MKLNKKIMFSLPVVLSIVSAIILVGSAIYSQSESIRLEKKNQENKDEISNQTAELLKVYRELSNANQNSNETTKKLEATYEELNRRNITLETKSNEIIHTGNKLNEANQKNSRLQDELYNLAIESKSFPLMMVDQITLPLNAFDESYSPVKERLVISLLNPGKYSVNNIEVSYDKMGFSLTTGRYDSSCTLPVTYNLTPGDPKKIVEFFLDDLDIVHPDPVVFRFRIKWKLEYICVVVITVPFETVAEQQVYSSVISYEFNNKVYSTAWEFQNAILPMLQ